MLLCKDVTSGAAQVLVHSIRENAKNLGINIKGNFIITQQSMKHKVRDSKVLDLWKINIFDKTIDDVIHALRIKYRIEIYNTAEPFVSPAGKNEGKVLYGFSVKICNPKWGWNARQYIGKTNWMPNVWEAKRKAINIAIKWILSHKSQKSKKQKIVAINANSKQKQN